MCPPCQSDQPSAAVEDAGPVAGSRHPPELDLTVPAVATSASLVRDRLRRWLEELSWPDKHRTDVVLAVNEAVTNSIEHAYAGGAAGLVQVHGRVQARPGGSRSLALSVRDFGTWRPTPTGPTNRRRGIPLMHACMSRVTIDTTAEGTRVRLDSAAVPERI